MTGWFSAHFPMNELSEYRHISGFICIISFESIRKNPFESSPSFCQTLAPWLAAKRFVWRSSPCLSLQPRWLQPWPPRWPLPWPTQRPAGQMWSANDIQWWHMMYFCIFSAMISNSHENDYPKNRTTNARDIVDMLVFRYVCVSESLDNVNNW